MPVPVPEPPVLPPPLPGFGALPLPLPGPLPAAALVPPEFPALVPAVPGPEPPLLPPPLPGFPEYVVQAAAKIRICPCRAWCRSPNLRTID